MKHILGAQPQMRGHGLCREAPPCPRPTRWPEDPSFPRAAVATSTRQPVKEELSGLSLRRPCLLDCRERFGCPGKSFFPPLLRAGGHSVVDSCLEVTVTLGGQRCVYSLKKKMCCVQTRSSVMLPDLSSSCAQALSRAPLPKIQAQTH